MSKAERNGSAASRRPTLLEQGFRPFFLLAGLGSALAMLLWLGVLRGALALPGAPLFWHAHEMLFGFVTAAAAGFLLTAIPNWTGRLPIGGWRLASLAALWLAGRVAMLSTAVLPPGLAAAVDLSFLAVLILVVAREIMAGRNWRNLPLCALLLLLFASNLLMHLEALDAEVVGPGSGQRLGVATVVMMISLIGGRIVPSFTRNWLAKRGSRALPAPFGRHDRVTLLATALALLAWVLLPGSAVAGWLLVLGGLLQAVRLGRWQGHRTLAEPLLWVLHLGYLWLPLGLFLLGGAQLWAGGAAAAGLHALTAGAAGTMILAVMTRATLGHSGRPLHAGAGTLACYLLVTVAALARAAAGLGASWDSLWIDWGYGLSALCWSAGFAVFIGLYLPLLAGWPRAAATRLRGDAEER